MDDKNKLIEKLGELSAKAYMFGRMYHIDDVTELTKDINELIAKVFEYSSWHTGTPTEEGWYLLKYKWYDEIRYITMQDPAITFFVDSRTIGWQKIKED